VKFGGEMFHSAIISPSEMADVAVMMIVYLVGGHAPPTYFFKTLKQKVKIF